MKKNKQYKWCQNEHTDAPQTYGQTFDGVDNGPAMLREDGLVGMCERYVSPNANPKLHSHRLPEYIPIDTLRFLGWRIASPGDCRVTMVPPRSEPHAPAMPDPSVKIPNNAWAVGTGNYHLFQKSASQ